MMTTIFIAQWIGFMAFPVIVWFCAKAFYSKDKGAEE